MKNRILHILKNRPLFVILLPFFFMFHAFTENYPIVKATDAVSLVLIYTGVIIGLSLLAWIFYRNIIKAALLAFALVAIQFFFGTIYDALKKNFEGATKYSFILPAILVILVIICILLKKSKKTYKTIGYFFNILLLVLILSDLVSLFVKTSKSKNIIPGSSIASSLTTCDTCSKPDIYLLLVDEYAGYRQLNEIFSFKNDSFETELKKRGFYVVPEARSNYNKTFYSMASCLNMKYLEGLRSTRDNKYDNFYCFDQINQADLLVFLQKQGYAIYNYSLFDLVNIPKLNDSYVIPTSKRLITSQMMTNRIMKNLGFHFVSRSYLKKILDHNLVGNNKADSLTVKTAGIQNNQPKFVYTHLMIPHHPYYFDRNGKETDFNSLLNDDFTKSEKNAYLEYLVYANNYLLGLTDRIKKASGKPPVIILMGDHGFRQFEANEKVDPRYYFMTLNAVHLPDSNYHGFYPGMTHVNQFRVILNNVFGQKLPLLKDSLSFISDH